jgi:hypothetical protein
MKPPFICTQDPARLRVKTHRGNLLLQFGEPIVQFANIRDELR